MIMHIGVAGLLLVAFALGRQYGRGELRRKQDEVEMTNEIADFEARVVRVR